MLKKEETSPEFYSPRSLVRTNQSLDASSHFSPASFSSCSSSPPSQHRSTDPEKGNYTHFSPSLSTLVPPSLSHNINTSPGMLLIDPLTLATHSASSPPFSSPCSPIAPKSKVRRKLKKNTADSCIRRLCASHQTDIGLLCDLWSSPSTNSTSNSFTPSDFSSVNNSLRGSPSSSLEPVVHAAAENTERQRLLQVEMQLMRMQLQQAELLLPPSRASSIPLSRNNSAVADESFNKHRLSQSSSNCSLVSENGEGPRKPTLRLEEDSTLSVHIAQEEIQNLLWAEADYRAHKRVNSKPTTPCSASPEDSDLGSAPPSQNGEFVNTPLCQGYLKMPRGVLCKFWGAKKRFCMLDSARCFFYWKSQEHREAGRAKCLNGVTGGALVSGDDKSLELTYAGGACTVLLRCDSAIEAQRWLVALASLDESLTERLDPDQGASLSHQSSVPSSCQVSPQLIAQPEVVRSRTLAQADCNTRREVIQNAFLDEFRKEQQFEQLLRSSKTPTARDASSAPSLAF